MQFNSPKILLAALTSIFLFSSCTKDIMEEDTEVLQATQLSASTSKTVTLAPIQDAYLQGSSPYNSSDIRLEENKRQGYLMFDLSNIKGSITAASLQFTIGSDPGHGTVKAYLGSGSNWTETNLSTQNRPSTGALLGSINKSYASGALQNITLNTSSFGKGKTSLILLHSNGNDLNLSSGETSKAPKLTITYSSSGSESSASVSSAIAPIQDAYLQGGTRYNSSIIRLEGNNRQGYLMFDLSNISGQITSASLQFTISSDPGNGTVKAYLGNGTSWTETNLSTRNRPSTGALLGSINKSYSIGATENIPLNASSITKGKISLVLVHSDGNDVAFASGESPNAPKLIVTSNGSESSSSKANVTTEFFGELKAFPTAEGFGQNATGGRGGRVVEVTNLQDSGEGSLRHALEEISGPRTIVFKVSGTINAKSKLSILRGSGNVTIAGQTAPSGGILIKDGELRIEGDNVIVSHLKIRMGPNAITTNGHNSDGIKIRSNYSSRVSDVIIDHCSVAWGKDENISITNAENVTIQNSIIGEADYGLLIQDGKKVSVLNNLFSLNGSRNITANTVKHKEITFEQINNIIYGFKWATAATDGMVFSAVKNNFKLSNGFNTSTTYCVTMSPANSANNGTVGIKDTHANIEGNIYETLDLKHYRSELNAFLRSNPKQHSGYIATDAQKLASKLLGHIGASVPQRDAVDDRLISHYINGTGTVRSSGSFPSISQKTGYKDSDKDGMSDEWEMAHGLNSKDAKDGGDDMNDDGYTNLEDFLYHLANR